MPITSLSEKDIELLQTRGSEHIDPKNSKFAYVGQKFGENLNDFVQVFIYDINNTFLESSIIDKADYILEGDGAIKLKTGTRTLTSHTSKYFTPTIKEIGTYELDTNSKQWILKIGEKIFTSNYYTNGIYDFCETTNTNYLSYGIKVYEDGDIEEGKFQLNKDSKKFKLIKKTQTNFNYKH